MSDLKLLSNHQPTRLERLLLDAVSSELPSAGQRMRVRQALGLPALPPPVPRVSRGAVLVKGAIAGAIVVSALILQFRPGKPDTVQPVAPVQQPLAVSTPSTPMNAPTPLSPEPIAQPLPALEVLPPPSAVKLRSVAKPSASGDLSEQLRLIESARAAVASHNAGAASQALASYSSRFPRGAFGQEAAVLRIETIDLQGNHAQAAALAKNFLARHPNSPHVGLVQRIASQSR